MSPSLERVLRMAAAELPGGFSQHVPLSEMATELQRFRSRVQDPAVDVYGASVAAWLEVYEGALVSDGGGS